MRKINTCTFFILVLLIALLTAQLSVSAEGESPAISQERLFYINPETGYTAVVEDDAGLMDQQEREALLSEMADITAYCGVMFKSVSDNPKTVSAFAEQTLMDNFADRNGTLFLVDMDNREIYICSDKYAYSVINDAYAESITDNVYRYASREAYYTCASEAFSQIRTLLEGGRIAQPMKHITNALMAMVLAILITFLFMLAQRRKVNTDPARFTKLKVTANVVTMGAFTILSTQKISNSSSGSSGGHSGGGFSGGGGGHKF